LRGHEVYEALAISGVLALAELHPASTSGRGAATEREVKAHMEERHKTEARMAFAAGVPLPD
jgi:predicted nuclease with RNAse H fold